MLEISTISSRHCAAPALLQLQAQYERYEGIRAKLKGVQNFTFDEGQISAPNAMKSWNHEPEIDANPRRC